MGEGEKKNGIPKREVNPMRIVSSGISSNTAQMVLIPNHMAKIEAYIGDDIWSITSPDSTRQVVHSVLDMNAELMECVYGMRSHAEAERDRRRLALDDTIFGGDFDLEEKGEEEEKGVGGGGGASMGIVGGMTPGLHTLSHSSTNAFSSSGDPFEFRKNSSTDIIRPPSSLPTTPIHTVTDLFCSQGRMFLKQISALDVPRLPPALGPLLQPDGSPFSHYRERVDTEGALDGGRRSDWKPRVNTPVFTTSEHAQPVNRLAVAQDHSFFASCSSDHTVKVLWGLFGLIFQLNNNIVFCFE